MRIEHGFHHDERTIVADLFWQAFRNKLGRVMGPEEKAIAFIVDVLDPTHALCARDDDGQLLGVVGFKTHRSALVGGGLRELARHYGWVSGLCRGLVISLLERDIENQRFLMDGIFVADHARGRGVGTALLNAIAIEAAHRGYSDLRLDVIDSNPRAKALYLRNGFVEGEVQQMGLLRYVFGFSSATTMVKHVSDEISPGH